ncbi:MAG: hypothetical protein ACE368_01800 [Paracoccaceae bacterium]
MSKSVKVVLGLSLVAFIAACSPKQEEVVYVNPEPISIEPAYTGKYK